MRHHKKILTACAVLCLFVLAVFAGFFGHAYLERREEERRREAFSPSVVPDDIVALFAADFTAMLAATEAKTLPPASFKNLSGEEKSLAAFAGTPTLVNFWATWCGPCVVELPSLEKLKEHYAGRLNVIAIAVSETRSLDEIRAFLEGRQIGPFAGFKDESDLFMNALDMRGLPTSFLIGADGHVLYRFEGDADWSSEASRTFFDAFLLQKV